MRLNWKLILLLLGGLLIRLLLVPQPGYEGDTVFWKTWSLAAVDHGVVWMATNTTFNYPAGYGLVLWLIGQTYNLLADIHNGAVFGQPTNFLFLLLAKCPSIAADLVTAGVIYLITKVIRDTQYVIRNTKENDSNTQNVIGNTKNAKRKNFLNVSCLTYPVSPVSNNVSRITSHVSPLLLSAAYLFHPVILFDGAWWGQVDSIGVAAALTCLYLLIKQKPSLATIILIGGFMLKLQVMILLPLFFLFIWLNYSWKQMVKCLSLAVVTFLIMSLPFIIAGNLARTYELIFLNSDYFPLLSLRADNIWNLVAGGNGIITSDKIMTIGIINAKNLGLILFSGVYLVCVGLVFKSRKLSELLTSSSTPRSKNNKPLLFERIPMRRELLTSPPKADRSKNKNVLSFERSETESRTKELLDSSKTPHSKNNITHLLFAFTLASLAFYLLPTQIHERYSFPVVVLGLVCLPLIIKKNKELLTSSETPRSKNKIKLLVTIGLYILFSLNALISYNNSLLVSYPVNGWNLGWLYQPTVAAIINIIIFITLLVYLLKKLPLRWLVGSITIIGSGIILLNLSYWFTSSIPLTSLQPTNVQFQYKYPEFNRSLNSFQGPNAWTFLSNNYYFYRQGISTNAMTVIIYNLSGRFSRFATDYGIDTEAGDKASAGFEIWADNQKVFNSEKMTKTDLPRRIEVPVVNIKTLILIVNDAGDGNTDDHGDWLEPTLIK